MAVTFAKGFLASGVNCGIKFKRNDLCLVFSVVPAVAAGLFTSSQFKAAPVLVDIEKLRKGRAQAVFVNSGNANCATGAEGEKDAWEMGRLAAHELGVPEGLVLVGSTGLIGKRLPMEKIRSGIPLVVKSLRKSWRDAARGIMTTDKRIKSARASVKIGGKLVKLGGFCKGAGMIRPNFATMLCFITTDAAIELSALRAALKGAVDCSFNCITVDGDMSTNDSVVVLANGKAGNKAIRLGSREFVLFANALKEVCLSLAKQIIRDGEGATKFVAIRVVGAASDKDARAVAFTVAESKLVKTALYGEDPNCGRILGAVGRAPARVRDDFTFWVNGVLVVKNGVGMFNYEKAKQALAGAREVEIKIDLRHGKGSAVVWTSDLSHGYVRENAAYEAYAKTLTDASEGGNEKKKA